VSEHEIQDFGFGIRPRRPSAGGRQPPHSRKQRSQGLHGAQFSPAVGRVCQTHPYEPAAAGFKEYTRVVALAGGLPIKVGIGLSGSPGKDDECAYTGIDKVADQLK
jgi:hypothetical protein